MIVLAHVFTSFMPEEYAEKSDQALLERQALDPRERGDVAPDGVTAWPRSQQTLWVLAALAQDRPGFLILGLVGLAISLGRAIATALF